MTEVQVTETTSSVVITEPSGEVVEIQSSSPSLVIEVIGVGPQGPEGPEGNFNLDESNKVHHSIIYYDAQSDQFKADTLWTTGSLVDGGNF